MGESMPRVNRLAARLGLEESGFAPTGLAGVKLFWADRPVARAPLLYDSGLIIMVQGRKILHVGDQVFTYDPDHYLVASLPVAAECETWASADAPLLGVFIDIDVATLFELTGFVDGCGPGGDPAALGVEPVGMHDDMREAVARLLTCLCDAADTAVLGPGVVREILYRALQHGRSSVLRAMLHADGRHARIARVLQGVRADLAQKRSVDEMAAEAGMSSPVFYRAFKTAMGDTPLQYIKKLRLTRARSLIVHENMRANDAAFAVGYESPSQFSREFKAYFGVTAAAARDSAYAFVRS